MEKKYDLTLPVTQRPVWAWYRWDKKELHVSHGRIRMELLVIKSEACSSFTFRNPAQAYQYALDNGLEIIWE